MLKMRLKSNVFYIENYRKGKLPEILKKVNQYDIIRFEFDPNRTQYRNESKFYLIEKFNKQTFEWEKTNLKAGFKDLNVIENLKPLDLGPIDNDNLTNWVKNLNNESLGSDVF